MTSAGIHVRLAGVTWDGMQSTDFVPSGLDFRPFSDILCEIKTLGFNTVRIPISDNLVYHNSRIEIRNDIDANPDLAGLHPLGVLDHIVAAAQRMGLMVILDNHFSAARPCPSNMKSSKCPANGHSLGGSGGPTRPWTDSGYTEADWVNDWVKLAQRYAPGHLCGYVKCGATPSVIGFDLHNEPHTNFAHHKWSLTDYLTRGATWGPYPTGATTPSKQWNPQSDWVQGAEDAGDAVLAVNPNLLMFVEGVQLYPDSTEPRGVEVYTWGGILRGVAIDPVRFEVDGQPVLDQLVYSPHEWGPWKDNLLQEFSYRTTYQSLKSIFMKNWGYVLSPAHPDIQAPIWLGEFNTCNSPQKHPAWGSPIKKAIGCVTSTSKGTQGQWFQIMLHFLRNNPEVGWSYYSINGTNWLNQPEDNSILAKDWTTVKLPPLLEALQRLPLPLVITASSGSIIYGTAIPAIQPAYSGLRANQSGPQGLPRCGTTASQQSPVGTYTTYCNNAHDVTYVFTYVPGVLTITPAPLKIQAKWQWAHVGGNLPKLTWKATFVNGDTADSLTRQPVCKTNAKVNSSGKITSSPGNYKIKCRGAKDPNYGITYAKGRLRVLPETKK